VGGLNVQIGEEYPGLDRGFESYTFSMMRSTICSWVTLLHQLVFSQAFAIRRGAGRTISSWKMYYIRTNDTDGGGNSSAAATIVLVVPARGCVAPAGFGKWLY